MKKAERFVRGTIVVLALFSIVAIVLQVINQKTTPVETAYEIITFSVAVVALALAVLQGIYNTRTTNELKKIIHDMNQVIKAEQRNLNIGTEMLEKIDADLEISKQTAKMLKDKKSSSK